MVNVNDKLYSVKTFINKLILIKMKIISKHNKKDFYDYLGFQYDTSDDIVYLRETKGLFTNKPEDCNIINNCYKLIKNKIPNYSHNVNFNQFKYHKYSCIISHVIIGIYPYIYVVFLFSLKNVSKKL